MTTHPAAIDPDALLRQCRLDRGRSSGPGGQHRNKVETLVKLTHEPTGVEAHAGERRSAEDNKRVALFRLRLALAVRVRQDVPPGDRRSELWRSRCSAQGRIACNPEHEDFPSMLAEAMDNVFAGGLDHAKAAARLCCTPTQLVKLLRDHPPALLEVNRARAERGMRALR